MPRRFVPEVQIRLIRIIYKIKVSLLIQVPYNELYENTFLKGEQILKED